MTGTPSATLDVGPDRVQDPGPDRRLSRRARVMLRVAVVVVLLVVGAAGWLVWRTLQVRDALREASDLVDVAATSARGGDVSGLAPLADDLADAAGRAVAATSDPVWSAASHLPWLGTQLAAVAVSSRALDDIATRALPPLVTAGAALDLESLGPHDGTVDLATLVTAAPAFDEAARAVDAAVARLDAIDAGRLLPAVAERYAPARDRLLELQSLVRAADTAAATIPPLLGADGPRSYLVLVLNPAELRSAGGIVGSVLELRADDGAIELVGQSSARTVARSAKPLVPLTPAELTLLGPSPAGWMQSVTASPELSRTAEWARALWRSSTGRQVDGVLTVDPVALSYLLEVTGGVAGPDGVVLDASNVLDELLGDAYARYPDMASSDAYFAGVAQTVWDATLAGGYSMPALTDALGRALSEGRLGLWTSDATVRDRLSGLGFAHDFLSDPREAGSAGVFVNDSSASKLDYYLRTDIGADALTCTADGATTTLHATFTSDVPADAATSLPWYVLGEGAAPTGELDTQVLLYSPVGGAIGEIEVTAGDRTFAAGGTLVEQAGRQAVALELPIQPGEQVRLDVRVTVPGGQRELALTTTPTLTSGRAAGVVGCT